jgi:hypothetical protein
MWIAVSNTADVELKGSVSYSGIGGGSQPRKK